MRAPRHRADDLVVFLGPSLPAREAMALAPCRVLPPARQGDLWRALSLAPRAVALVDGVFHQVPSVWHREILEAMQAGVAVFGGASMGALRASELWTLGMIGVGTIFGWYRDGRVRDDAEVALLHAGPELGHRPLTVPLVNLRHAAARAREEGVLSARHARRLVERAGALFYQDRTWPALLEASGLPRVARSRFEAFARDGQEDLKARDARACIEAAARFVASGAPAAPPSAAIRVPSLARRRRLAEGEARRGARAVRGAAVLERLDRSPRARGLTRRGLARSLLAAAAREQGLAASAEEVAAVERAWRAHHRAGGGRGAALLALCGLDAGQARALLEEVALERKVLRLAERMVNDGPSRQEALASQARLEGDWAEAAGALLGSRQGRRR